MGRPTSSGPAALAVCLLSLPLLGACASGGGAPLSSPPATAGTHTVMGRAFFPGGIMILLDAHLTEGAAGGMGEYSRVQSGGEATLRVRMDVRCVGVFRDGTTAVVTGPIQEVVADQLDVIDHRDWWVIQLEEGGEEGDRVLAGPHRQDRALRLCQEGPTQAATLQAVAGDLAIY